MLDEISDFQYWRALVVVSVLAAGNAFLLGPTAREIIGWLAYKLGGGNVNVAVGLDIVLEVCIYGMILSIGALFYFSGAKAGLWQGILLALFSEVGRQILKNINNIAGGALGMPTYVLHWDVWELILLIVIFASFGVYCARQIDVRIA